MLSSNTGHTCGRLLYSEVVATVSSSPAALLHVSLLLPHLAIKCHCPLWVWAGHDSSDSLVSIEGGRSGATWVLQLDQKRSCSVHLVLMEHSSSRCSRRECRLLRPNHRAGPSPSYTARLCIAPAVPSPCWAHPLSPLSQDARNLRAVSRWFQAKVIQSLPAIQVSKQNPDTAPQDTPTLPCLIPDQKTLWAYWNDCCFVFLRYLRVSNR